MATSMDASVGKGRRRHKLLRTRQYSLSPTAKKSSVSVEIVHTSLGLSYVPVHTLTRLTPPARSVWLDIPYFFSLVLPHSELGPYGNRRPTAHSHTGHRAPRSSQSEIPPEVHYFVQCSHCAQGRLPHARAALMVLGPLGCRVRIDLDRLRRACHPVGRCALKQRTERVRRPLGPEGSARLVRLCPLWPRPP